MQAIRLRSRASNYDYGELVQRLDSFLLSDAVICPSAGAVFGVRYGPSDYTYPEIAGYYLSYLAGLMRCRESARAVVERRARQVVAWLQSISHPDMPLTRYYAFDGMQDWRNDFVFSFDLAMILRGLAHQHRIGVVSWDASSLADYLLAKMTDEDGRLAAVHARGVSAAPSGWATRIDAYQLKTAAGLACYAREYGHAALSKLAEQTAGKCMPTSANVLRQLPLHPRFYALEGLLSLQGRDCHPQVGGAVLRGLEEGSPDVQRVDVLAQALRLCCITRPEHPAVHRLASTLGRVVDQDGSVRFRLDSSGPERNTWCALFVRQALSYYLAILNGEDIDVSHII